MPMPEPVVMTDDDPEPQPAALERSEFSQLATLKGEAMEIIEARAQVLHTLRLAAIRATHPTDWIRYKSPDEQVVCYLDDAGCDRVRDLFGIEVFDISRPEKIAGTEPNTFLYILTGCGRSKFTGQVVEAMEGGRSSTDDFCKDKSGADLELVVRKAARANLDGNVTRELAGLKSVPVDELARAWEGTPKKVDGCRMGRGYGSRIERLGVTTAAAPTVPPPMCGVCQPPVPGVWSQGKDGKPDFYYCPKYRTHPPNRKWFQDAAPWVAKQQALAAVAVADRPCSICGVKQKDHNSTDHDWDDPGAAA